jgi:hypothetical protein
VLISDRASSFEGQKSGSLDFSKATASQAREKLSAVRRLFSFAVVRQFAL